MTVAFAVKSAIEGSLTHVYSLCCSPLTNLFCFGTDPHSCVRGSRIATLSTCFSRGDYNPLSDYRPPFQSPLFPMKSGTPKPFKRQREVQESEPGELLMSPSQKRMRSSTCASAGLKGGCAPAPSSTSPSTSKKSPSAPQSFCPRATLIVRDFLSSPSSLSSPNPPSSASPSPPVSPGPPSTCPSAAPDGFPCANCVFWQSQAESSARNKQILSSAREMMSECRLMHAGARRMRVETAVMKIRTEHVHERVQKLVGKAGAAKYIREVAEELEPGLKVGDACEFFQGVEREEGN